VGKFGWKLEGQLAIGRRRAAASGSNQADIRRRRRLEAVEFERE
jgi:hypothetical protein